MIASDKDLEKIEDLFNIDTFNDNDESLEDQLESSGPTAIRTWARSLGIQAKESMQMLPIKITHPQRVLIHFGASGTVDNLYDIVSKAVSIRGYGLTKIAIVFDGIILLNDRRTIAEVGINGKSNQIQVILKPDYVALLEMVMDIDNKENIPWFECAVQWLSDSSANHSQTVSQFGKGFTGLQYDSRGFLFEVDLSHLNLSGTINLKVLPQSVLSLDLSFNDLESFDSDGLRGKSLKRLNVEKNDRCHINIGLVRKMTLQVSLNQLFPGIASLKQKYLRMKQWVESRNRLNVLIVDGESITRGTSLSFYQRMVNVVDGVTNKERIPWYQHFLNNKFISRDDLHLFGIGWYRKHHKVGRDTYEFDLSGLSLEGHVDLGCLPRNVVKMDLSHNNLSSICFHGDGNYHLRELNIGNNDNLSIDLMALDRSTMSCCLHRAYLFFVSSNQLVSGQGDYVT